MDTANAFQVLGIALGLGLLVGIQREKVDAPLAGVRTFALITVFGTLCGLLAPMFGAWVVAAGLLAVTVTVAMGNMLYLKQGKPDLGITTEIAVLLMYGIGAYLAFGERMVAVVLGAAVTVLLHAKPIMHRFVKRLGENDMWVMVQFVLISLVILPVLPDRPYGPYGVLNPREIWWMVVLVVGISLVGYIALKLVGGHAGVLLAGLVGGMVSSTATTVSFARKAADSDAQVSGSTMVILLATTVVYVRVLIEVFIAAPGIFAQVAPPVAIMMASSVLACVIQWWRSTRRARVEMPAQGNPTELKPALVFGVLYALVLLAVAWARDHLGERGIYVAAGISGLTDMDAITLGTSRMGARGGVPTTVVWRAIVIATMANLAFKTATVVMLGGPAIGRRVGLLFAVSIATGLALLAWWPG